MAKKELPLASLVGEATPAHLAADVAVLCVKRGLARKAEGRDRRAEAGVLRTRYLVAAGLLGDVTVPYAEPLVAVLAWQAVDLVDWLLVYDITQGNAR